MQHDRCQQHVSMSFPGNILLSLLLQIDLSELQYAIDDFSRTMYSFPVHIRILLGVTLGFLVIILILLGVVLGSRIFKTGRSIKREQIRNKYQKVFRILLFEERSEGVNITEFFEEKDLKNSFHREVIKEEIIHLHDNFTGETAERLEEIFMRLNFHFDSIAKLRNKRWYVVAKGMRELALMNIRQALPEISRFVNSDNELLRMEARVSVMKLSEKDPLSFLNNETTHLSDWDTANIHSMLTKMPEKMIPDFSQWLDSNNKDVVLFCVRMIGAFRQQGSVNRLLELLKSDDQTIRMATVKALRYLNAAVAEEPVMAIYAKEGLPVQVEILKTLETVGSQVSAPFLERILRQPLEDYPLMIQAVRALLSLGKPGEMIVERVYQETNEPMKLIINHAKDRRL